MSVIHIGVADVKRRFADIIGRVMYAGDRIVVERRGRPVVAIVPLSDLVKHGDPRPDAVAEQGHSAQEEPPETTPADEAVAESFAAPPKADSSRPDSILDALGCGGPEAEEFCKIIDEIIEQRSLDLGRPAPDLQ